MPDQPIQVKDIYILYELAKKYKNDQKMREIVEYEIYKILDKKYRFALQDELNGIA